METKNVFLAITLSVAILIGYQILFVPPPPVPTEQQTTTESAEKKLQTPAAETDSADIATPRKLDEVQQRGEMIPVGRDIHVETGLYSAVLSEVGGGVKSFKLKEYQTTLEDSSPVELITTQTFKELPLFFTWGVAPTSAMIPGYLSDTLALQTSENQKASLNMKSRLPSGLEIVRHWEFADNDYQMLLTVKVVNTTQYPVQGAPYLSLTNRPFQELNDNRWLFTGPAVHMNQELTEIKLDDLEKGNQNFSGKLDWVAYEDPYFMCGIIPLEVEKTAVTFSVSNKNKVTTLLAGDAAIIQPQEQREYKYLVYFGPKKLSILKTVDENLHRIVDFGWYDIIARPTLYLLNFLYKFINNYGIAIILVTILIKLAFWPISQKGMKSMKTLQKIQPKMAKLREKYKDDRERLNREMIQLYQTYKVNPLGGCLPMLLQIPVFFALYKVLLQAIELRHAPFMLWINDLSAPDRLYIGFDIPFLGGIPVLTLLMGGSMFLQQKMTPTTGDPTQAKIMMFLPVIFTFMFLNFASGLVLYWFVNNLLSIGQQHFINRQTT